MRENGVGEEDCELEEEDERTVEDMEEVVVDGVVDEV